MSQQDLDIKRISGHNKMLRYPQNGKVNVQLRSIVIFTFRDQLPKTVQSYSVNTSKYLKKKTVLITNFRNQVLVEVFHRLWILTK